MALQLNIMEMLDALKEIEHPEAEDLKTQAEDLATRMAQALGQALDCNAGPADHQGMAFAGLCAPFTPKRHDQECPAVLSQFDDGGEDEWQEDCADICTECDEPSTGGDGQDGKCGNCADKDAAND